MRTLSPQWRKVLIGSWIMIGLLSVVTLVLYVDNKRTRGCIADYMTKDQKASQVRFQLADEERQQFKITLQTLVSGEADPKKRFDAIKIYIDLLNRNDQIRKDNPVQPVPTDCS